MGESCEEGGPSPSHKIPREDEDGFKCSKQLYIHLPKRLSTMELRLAYVLQNLSYRPTKNPPCFMQMSPLYRGDIYYIRMLHRFS